MKKLNDITVGDYMSIVSILKNDNLEEYEKEIELVSLVSEKDCWQMDIDSFQKTKTEALTVIEEMQKYSTTDTYTIVKEIDVNGRVFQLTQNLNDMNVKQYYEYQDFTSKNNETDDMLPYVLATLLIPKGEIYGEYDVKEVADYLKNNLSFIVARQYCFFFLLTSRRLYDFSLDCSLMWVKLMKKLALTKQKKTKLMLLEEILKMKKLEATI